MSCWWCYTIKGLNVFGLDRREIISFFFDISSRRNKNNNNNNNTEKYFFFLKNCKSVDAVTFAFLIDNCFLSCSFFIFVFFIFVFFICDYCTQTGRRLRLKENEKPFSWRSWSRLSTNATNSFKIRTVKRKRTYLFLYPSLTFLLKPHQTWNVISVRDWQIQLHVLLSSCSWMLFLWLCCRRIWTLESTVESGSHAVLQGELFQKRKKKDRLTVTAGGWLLRLAFIVWQAVCLVFLLKLNLLFRLSNYPSSFLS